MRAPVKIFGDIHGQLHEINRFFEAFGAPFDEPPLGDIECTNYLFLGDYVDRGNKSIETILMLFSLKIKFPENIILLRGAHEDRQINKFMGFGDECSLKLKENIDDQYSFFSRVNRLFEKMPLAAVIEDNIFCSHGGIGQTLKSMYELDKIDKPLRVVHDPKSKQ
jgi:protein phosphatase